MRSFIWYNITSQAILHEDRYSNFTYFVLGFFYWMKEFIDSPIYSCNFIFFSLIKILLFLLFSIIWRLHLIRNSSFILKVSSNKRYKHNRKYRRAVGWLNHPSLSLFGFRYHYAFNVQLHKHYMLHLINWKNIFKSWF